MELEVREFDQADIEQIIKIDEIFPPKSRPPITANKALSLHQKNKDACFVAVKGREIIAALFGELQGRTYMIKFLIIHPDYIGEGIAPLLIDAATKATKAKDIAKI